MSSYNSYKITNAKQDSKKPSMQPSFLPSFSQVIYRYVNIKELGSRNNSPDLMFTDWQSIPINMLNLAFKVWICSSSKYVLGNGFLLVMSTGEISDMLSTIYN